MPADPAAIKSIFLEAAAIDDTAARADLLRLRCQNDAALLARVQALLSANERALANAGTMTAAPLNDSLEATADLPGKDEHVGAVLAGKYKLIEEIGEGGMGNVFMAQQTEPVKRAVAVKVIKAGMDSKAVLARFEAERQALAMMDHPNIAKVLDAGTTGEPGGVGPGRPYFVMELVKGVPITQFCDERKLTLRQRLELFVPVCQAIQHAHQKGVIHRDIKPNNVLVAMYDDRPVPKVIDFGVAKAAGQALTDKTLMTGFGAVVGTPEYMSPEQANMNNLDIDTRSDVYSLGVLLYELLTGSTPVDRKSLGKAALLEILRIVREVEAPRPSAKLSTIDTLPSVAANRGTEPAKLSKLMKGELDWVLLKALEKDRARRYETANGLAADLQRYLAGEQVQAVPASAGYRLRKFYRRNRSGVWVAAGFLFLSYAGTSGIYFAYQKTLIAEAAAARGRDEAETARRAESERAEGERQARLEEQRQTIRAVEAEAAATAAKRLSDSRLKHVERANEVLGGIFEDLNIQDSRFKDIPLQTLLAVRLFNAAKKLDEKAVGDPITVARLRMRLGNALASLEYFDEAIPVLTKAREVLIENIGEQHEDVAIVTNTLASVYTRTGKSDLARPLLERLLKTQKEREGPDAFGTAIVTNSLAMCYEHSGDRARAVPLYEEALRIFVKLRGKDSAEAASMLDNLATCHANSGRFDLALPLYQEAYPRMRAAHGADNTVAMNALLNLAECCQKLGKHTEAVPLLEDANQRVRARHGAGHPLVVRTVSALIDAYIAAGERDKLVPIIADFVRECRARSRADDPTFPSNLHNAAEQLALAGQLAPAEAYAREALKLREARWAEAWNTFNTRSLLGWILLEQGKLGEAEPLLLAGYEGMRAREKTIPPQASGRMPEALNRLIKLYTAMNKPDEATKWRTERGKYPQPRAPMPREVK